MANKTFLRNFEEFRGLDLFSSHLSRDPKFATEFSNCEISKQKSIVKRKGFKVAAQFDTSTTYWPRLAITEYSYSHPQLDEEQREIVGVGENEMFTLRTGSLLVKGPSQSSVSFLPSASNGRWYFDCMVNGVSVGGSFPYDCGTGAGNSTTPTLYQLFTAINALGGGWSAVLTPHAIVNGGQTGRDHSNPVLVKDGHTLTTTLLPGGYRMYQVQTTAGTRFYDCIEISGNNIRFKPKRTETSFSVANGALIGVGSCPAAILPVTLPTYCSNPGHTLLFNFWEAIFKCYYYSNWYPFAGADFSLKQASNILFIGTSREQNTVQVGWDYTSADVGGALKYDSKDLYVAGLPKPIVHSISLRYGTELGVGRYKYLAEIVKTDEVGNEIHGNATDIAEEISITTTTASQRVEISLRNLGYYTEFAQRSAIISAPMAAPGYTFSVMPTYNYLRLGDWVYFKDLITNSIVLRQVVGLTDSEVTVGGTTPIQVTNALDSLGNEQKVVSNTLFRVYRTKVGGSFYYLLLSPGVPMWVSAGPWLTTIIDATPDTSLGEMWEGPFLGRNRRDLPPPCPLVEGHQGLLVGINNPKAGNRLYWSNYESPEYWSRSTNYQDITSTESGPFTAMASSSTDTLILFKEDCYKPISGDLFYGNISLTAEPQSEAGCPSHRALITFNGGVLFLSKSGPRIIIGDTLQAPDRRLTGAFYHGVDVSQWTAAVDLYNHRFIFCPPGISGSSSLGPIYTYDYVNDTWQTIATKASIFAAGGFLASGKNLFLLGGVTSTRGVLYQQIRTNTMYDYIDAGANTIDMVFRPQWDFLEEPGVDKEFLRIIVYSLLATPFIPFELKVKTYRNFQTTTADTESSVSFSQASNVDGEVVLTLNRAKALQIEFSNSKRLECPHITGYEVEVALPYRKEHVRLQTT